MEIIYFAASVFWRGWSFDWSRVSDFPQLKLPPGLGLEFRDFLLGKSPFPSSVVLHVISGVNIGRGVWADLSLTTVLKKQIAHGKVPVILASAFYYPIFSLNLEAMFTGITEELRLGLATVVDGPLRVQRNRIDNSPPIFSV